MLLFSLVVICLLSKHRGRAQEGLDHLHPLESLHDCRKEGALQIKIAQMTCKEIPLTNVLVFGSITIFVNVTNKCALPSEGAQGASHVLA